MIRRPPRSTLDRSSAASDVYKRQVRDRRQGSDRGLGRRRLGADQRLDDVDTVVAGPVGEGATQGGGLHLLRGPLVVVTRLGAVDDATAGELRRAGRALTGATGALLLVGLAATAAD